MPRLTIGLHELTVRRLEALAAASGKTADELVREALDSLTGSFKSRRAILKAQRSAPGAAGTNPLGDLGWLEGYAGQTVDELRLFEASNGWCWRC
jgi:hypothetical protein